MGIKEHRQENMIESCSLYETFLSIFSRYTWTNLRCNDFLDDDLVNDDNKATVCEKLIIATS